MDLKISPLKLEKKEYIFQQVFIKFGLSNAKVTTFSIGLSNYVRTLLIPLGGVNAQMLTDTTFSKV